MVLYGLVNLPNDNLYRLTTLNRIFHLCNKTNLVDHKGPICLLYDTFVKYDHNECLYNFMTGSSTLSKGEWKPMVSLKVMFAEKELWYININLYSALKLFRGVCVKLGSLFGCIWLTWEKISKINVRESLRS